VSSAPVFYEYDFGWRPDPALGFKEVRTLLAQPVGRADILLVCVWAEHWDGRRFSKFIQIPREHAGEALESDLLRRLLDDPTTYYQPDFHLGRQSIDWLAEREREQEP